MGMTLFFRIWTTGWVLPRLLAMMLLATMLPLHGVTAKPKDTSERTRILEQYGRLPLAFVENPGETVGGTAFVMNAAAFSLQFRDDGHLLNLAQGRGEAARAHTVRVELVGARTARIVGEGRAPGHVSYFKGRRAQWQVGLPV